MSLYKLVKFLMSDFSVKGLKKEFLYKEFFKRETCKIINFPSKGKNEGLVNVLVVISTYMWLAQSLS